MKNIFYTLLIINFFFLSNACTKTAIDPAKETVKEPVDERIIDTASYSRWLPAMVPNATTIKHYTVITGTPRTLTADNLKNGKVLVFGRLSELYQPYILPSQHFYFTRRGHGDLSILRRTYFKDQVNRITVYDSLISVTYRSDYQFSLDPWYSPYYHEEFRCIIVPPALKAAAIRAKINWSDYTAVTSFFRIAP